MDGSTDRSGARDGRRATILRSRTARPLQLFSTLIGCIRSATNSWAFAPIAPGFLLDRMSLAPLTRPDHTATCSLQTLRIVTDPGGEIVKAIFGVESGQAYRRFMSKSSGTPPGPGAPAGGIEFALMVRTGAPGDRQEIRGGEGVNWGIERHPRIAWSLLTSDSLYDVKLSAGAPEGKPE